MNDREPTWRHVAVSATGTCCYSGQMQRAQLGRRQILSFIGSAAVWPIAARAQRPAIPRVGYIWIGNRETDVRGAGLRQGLEDRGYVIGRSLILEERYAHGDAKRVAGLVAELLELKVDVLATPGTPITLAARRASSKIPIVMLTGDPVGTGLIESLSHPGGNITGLSLLSGDYSVKWLELLKEVVPGLQRVAVLWNPDNPQIVSELGKLRRAAPTLGIELTALSGRPTEIEETFAAIRSTGFDGLVVADDSSFDPLTPRIVAITEERRLPAIYPFSHAVRLGGLMSYSADFFELWRRGAGYVDRILKGALPSGLPVEQATSVALKVNLKTAKLLGLNIPPTVLARADEVIE